MNKKIKTGRRKKKFSVSWLLLGTVLTLYMLFLALLIYWALITSLKSQGDFRTNMVFGFPDGHIWEWAWVNFKTVFENFQVNTFSNGTLRSVGFFEMLLYTLLYAGVGAFISTIVPCLVAYVCAKFDFKFSAVIYLIVIVAMALPIVGSAPSELRILRALGMYDTIWGNWIQKFHFLGMYFLVFYARFKSLSNEYMEAAYVDGASEFQVLTKVMLPLVRTVFSTVFLIKFVDYWNDYQTPLLYMPSYPTLAVGVYNLSYTTVGVMSYTPMRMAACIILVVPIFILFVVFRDKLMGNLTAGGVKE